VYLGKANLREPRPVCKTIPRYIRVFHAWFNPSGNRGCSWNQVKTWR